VIDALRKISSPSVANAIETFNVRPRDQGNMSSQIRTLFPEMGPLVGYAVPCVIRAEPQPLQGHRASTYGWWDYVLTIPAPRVIVVHDLDDPRGQGAQWGEVQANIHKALGCVGVITDGSVRDLDAMASGFFVLAGSIMPSHAHVHLVEFGGTVSVAGMVVSANDIIHADRHGAVVIPPDAVEKIPAAVELLTRREKVLIEASKQPGFSVDRLRQAYREQDEIH
jgi:regulator of RNase E activity RraA